MSEILRNKMLSNNNKLRLQAFVSFLISPIYVPVVICWENRKDIAAFYKECWQIAKGTHSMLED